MASFDSKKFQALDRLAAQRAIAYDRVHFGPVGGSYFSLGNAYPLFTPIDVLFPIQARYIRVVANLQPGNSASVALYRAEPAVLPSNFLDPPTFRPIPLRRIKSFKIGRVRNTSGINTVLVCESTSDKSVELQPDGWYYVGVSTTEPNSTTFGFRWNAEPNSLAALVGPPNTQIEGGVSSLIFDAWPDSVLPLTIVPGGAYGDLMSQRGLARYSMVV
jgi:hypothetical protein